MGEKQQKRGGDADGGAKLLGKEFVAGSFAGAAGVVLGHPLDTIKTRIQTSSSSQSFSTLGYFKSMARSEGVRSFYRGMSWPFLSKSIEQCLLFGLNEHCRKLLPRVGLLSEDGDALTIVSGALAGVITFATITPIYVVKVQLQIDPRERIQAFSGPVQCAGFNLRRYGIRGLYAGFSASLLSNPICFGVRFITYEKTCSMVSETMQYAEDKLHLYRSQQQHLPLSSGGNAPISTSSRDMIAQIIGGGIAGMATWASIYPFDVVLSNMQAQGAQKKFQNKRQGLVWHVRNIYEKGGTRAFFKGLEPCLLRAFPVNAMMFLTYEQTLKWL